MLCVLWKKRRNGLYILICVILVMSCLPVLQGKEEEKEKERRDEEGGEDILRCVR